MAHRAGHGPVACLALSAVVGMILGGCGGAAAPRSGRSTGPTGPLPSSSVKAAPPPSASASPSPAAPAAACGTTPVPPGITRQTLVAQGVVRSYLLAVPVATGGPPPPLVVALHGYGGSAAQFAAYTGLPTAGLAAHVIVVTPDGVGGRWNFVRRPAVGPDDVDFLTTLLAAVRRLACYDTGHVVVAGYSDGADMADTFGCARPGLVAAVYGVAPSIAPVSCPRPPATVVEVHGTADPIVPFNGGGGDRPFPFQGTEAQQVSGRMQIWAARDGCTGGPLQRAVAGGVYAEQWACPAGRQLGLLVVQGGGHTWPGAAPVPALGATTEAISANAEVIALADHPHQLPW